MNLMSESTNGKRATSPVLVLVCVTMPLTYASPTAALRFVIVAGSVSLGWKGAGAKKGYGPPRPGGAPGGGNGGGEGRSPRPRGPMRGAQRAANTLCARLCGQRQ